MLDAARANVFLRAALVKLARTNRDYLPVLLRTADRVESTLEISALLTEDPELESFTRAQRKSLFAAWFQRGDRSQLTRSLLDHPEWQEDGWMWLAQNYADAKNYEAACEVVRKFAAHPAIPAPGAEQPRAELERKFSSNPEDLLSGLALYFSQQKLGETDAALSTLLVLGKIAEHPPYVSYLEAELCAEKGDWENAWNAWRQYASAKR